MKKPRGKQPTKPNLQKALLTRDLELKGSDKATLTVPIIYRKTFDWDYPRVTFVPINHRGFVVFRGDLDDEEYRRDLYSKITLNIESLPQYTKTRVKKNDKTVSVELKEAILAASLKNRYVQITIPKPKDAKLFEYIKKDMEGLVSELGFEYSTDHVGIHCTFKFPKHDIKYYALESKACVQSVIDSMNYFRNLIAKNKFAGALGGTEELLYNVYRLELLMDRYYSDALNIIWDLPNISNPGYFQWINSCERILDEFIFIATETNDAVKSLKPQDIKIIGMDKDIFGYVWDKAIAKSLEYCETAISTIELEPTVDGLKKAFFLINNYEHHRQEVGTNQSRFIKLFTGEDSYFKEGSSAQRLLTASYHLINIFQATERIIVFSKAIAKNSLHIGMFNKAISRA